MKLFIRTISLLWLVIPVAASAGSLDDYYLSRLVPPSGNRLSALVAGAPAAQPTRDLTGIRRAAKLDWEKLQPATQKTLAKVLARPVLSGVPQSFTSPGGHFTIHYTTTGTDALVDLTDTSPQNGTPDWVDTVAAVFEHVYDVEVTTMGYTAPPVTSYDIYLEDLVPQRAYGFTSDDTPVTATSYASYIEIDKSFTNGLYVDATGGPFTPLTSLQITAAHEFHHAIQFGYNFFFDTWYAEATSTWMEDEVYDSANQLYSYLSHYLPSTHAISLNADKDGGSEYARWIFNRYLAEKFGTAVVKGIWERLRTRPAPAGSNDIPMLPIIDEELVSRGSSIGNEFFGFAKKLLFRQNWTSHLSDVPLIYSHPLEIIGPFSVANSVTAPKPALGPYTFVYYQYSPASAGGSFTFDFSGKDPNLAVTAFRQNANGTFDEFVYDAAASAITVPDFPQGSQLYLVLCNNSASATAGTSITPAPSPQPKSSSGGGCFIATAAYGSYLHPKVAELRHFRDRYLMTNAPGRLFVSLYYRLSPPVARVIGEHEWMRAAVRVMLAPVVLAVEHMVGALLVTFLSGGAVVWRLTRRRAHLSVGAAFLPR